MSEIPFRILQKIITHNGSEQNQKRIATPLLDTKLNQTKYCNPYMNRRLNVKIEYFPKSKHLAKLTNLLIRPDFG
jgi:hypothetical protein